MEPITCSCHARCRMYSFCLTCPVVPSSYSVRLPVVSSIPLLPPLLACLVSSCPSRLAARLSTCRAGRFGNRRRFCLRLRRPWRCRADVVRVSCGGCLLLSSLTPRLCPSPRSLDTGSGEGEGSWRCRCLLHRVFYRLSLSLACGADGAGLLACSYGCRSFPFCDVRVRGFCGSRSLRLPGLLRHGILMSCRRGEDECDSGSSEFFGLFFYSDCRSALYFLPVFDAL